MVKIVDVFYSIQGEGAQTGVACVFVRLHGCNLACSFCDEALHKGTYEALSFEEILARIAPFPSRHVVITGGEPSLYDLRAFIGFLQTHGYHVAVETNGYDFANLSGANWVTYSPKEWDAIKQEGFDELKFVVARTSPVKKILAFHTQKPVFIQPQNAKDAPDWDNVAFCIDLVKAHPQFRLSVQLHKFLGVA